MVRSTKGIVLKSFKYSETSLIVKIFTRELGLQSYIVNGVRKTRGKQKASLFSPLTLLDLEVYHKETQQLKRIKEFRNYNIYRMIPFDVFRSSIGMFVSEVLYKSIKSDQEQTELFDLVESLLIQLDGEDTELSHFPINFMILLSESLGFGPLNNRTSEEDIFDLVEGRFSEHIPDHMNYFEIEPSKHFCKAIDANLTNKAQQKIPKTVRNILLQGLQNYFRLHIENFGEMNSTKILQEVLAEA